MTKENKDWFDRSIKIAGFAIVLGGFIWAFAKYPDRAEFNDTISAQETQLKTFQVEMRQLQIDQVKVRASVQAIEASGIRLERDLHDVARKLDRILETPKRNR